MCWPCACLHPAYTSGSVVTNGIHNKYSTPIQQQRAILLLLAATAAAESDESKQHHQVQCGMLSEICASSLKIDVLEFRQKLQLSNLKLRILIETYITQTKNLLLSNLNYKILFRLTEK